MIGIVTDSTCDIPENLLEQYGIIVVPQFVTWADKQYRDRVDLQPGEFYQRLKTESELPHTSMPGVADFKNAFDQAIEQGANELIVLTVSSAMSGTYEVARTAAAQLTIPVTVVDSKGPTMTLGWQTLAAARARDAGNNLAEIIKQIGQVRSKLVQYVGMVTMEFLQYGGRIGEAARWAGTLLKVKPLVAINHQSGVVQPVSLLRTTNSMIEMLYRKFFEHFKNRENLRIAVLHGNDEQTAESLAERIRDEFHPIELLINTTGPVLGINTGPGALALCGYAED